MWGGRDKRMIKPEENGIAFKTLSQIYVQSYIYLGEHIWQC
jgi:hypothetical protein